jgi:hypothetical protein
MRILWVVGTRGDGFGPTPDATELSGSALASDRLRIALPAERLRALGVESHFCALAPDRLPNPAGYVAVVAGKFASAGDQEAPRAALWLRYLEQAREAGCRLVADVSDNPFFKPSPRAELYRRLLPICAAITVPSEAMVRELAGSGPRPRVVNDPYEGEPGAARFAPGDPVRLLWFGHKVNFPYLHALLPALAELSRARALALEVVSARLHAFDALAADMANRSGNRLQMSFTEWTPAAVATALARCDLVLVPSDATDPRKRAASANRVTESLIAGRLPIATALESYQPFADAALLRADLVAGVTEALSAPAQMLARISAGQRRIAAAYSPAAVAAEWRAVLAG